MAIIGDCGYWPYTLGRSVRLYTDGCVVDSGTGLMGPCNHSKEDREAFFRDHINIIQGLEHLRDWLKNRYLAEVRETWHHLKIHSRDIDHLLYPGAYEDQHPGNKCVFYRNRGATMEDVEIWPKNAPCIANVMIEALAWHDHWQREARDHQEYQRQLDSTNLPGVAFQPPRTADRDVTTELDPTLLEGVVGAMAALEPSNSTTASEPSESTVPVPEKKKITLDEYNCRKALKLQQTATSPNLDENGECLDYDDFKPDDNPDNIQIDYQMPAPLLALSPQTRIPSLEDAPCLCHRQPLNHKSALAPVVSLVPWSTPPQPSTEPLALAGDCQCLEQCQYRWEHRRIRHNPCK